VVCTEQLDKIRSSWDRCKKKSRRSMLLSQVYQRVGDTEASSRAVTGSPWPRISLRDLGFESAVVIGDL
jgi:hypothetical protein